MFTFTMRLVLVQTGLKNISQGLILFLLDGYKCISKISQQLNSNTETAPYFQNESDNRIPNVSEVSCFFAKFSRQTRLVGKMFENAYKYQTCLHIVNSSTQKMLISTGIERF